MDYDLQQAFRRYAASRDPSDAVVLAELLLRKQAELPLPPEPTPLEKPLTQKEIIRQLETNGTVRGVATIGLGQIVESDQDAWDRFFDILEHKIVGPHLLMGDVEHRIVGIIDGDLVVELSGIILNEDVLEDVDLPADYCQACSVLYHDTCPGVAGCVCCADTAEHNPEWLE